jgi:hypothetical protein
MDAAYLFPDLVQMAWNCKVSSHVVKRNRVAGGCSMTDKLNSMFTIIK